ncbi:MAG: hypothetical protein ACLGH8_13705 [Bacteroidia bacterium]
MSQVDNYANLLSEIFGQEIILKDKRFENNCIGALLGDKFPVFKENFIKRLKRLQEFFASDPDTISQIIVTAKSIGQTAGYKWSGAYSELVALDYWISFPEIPDIKFVVKDSVDTFPDSVARRIGQQDIDLDLEVELSTKRILSDVKSFIPLHKELTDLIIKRVKDKASIQDFLISVDNIYDIDYLRVKKDLTNEMKGGLVANLVEAVENQRSSLTHTLTSNETINFRMSYARPDKNTVLTTIREMNPYKLAKDYRFKILDYYNKLVFKRPSVITWVINPWFNDELNSANPEFKLAFLRSLSRRIFIELASDDTKMSELFKDFNQDNDMTIGEISKLISGVIFIIDTSVLNDQKDLYKSYIFLNPKATNKLVGRDFGILGWSKQVHQTEIDDFQDDCY